MQRCFKSAGATTCWNYARLHRHTCQPPAAPSQVTRSCRALCRAASSSSGGGGYWTLEGPQQYEVEIKKSRFVVSAWPITSSDQAQQLLADHSDPAATHNCYAWKLGAAARSSDDGEPSGTAGKPILGAIQGDGLDGVCVLVTRYYGGVKLGAGGLVRAYGGAARDCVRAATKVYVKQQVRVQVTCPFELLGAVYGVLNRHGAEVASQGYTAEGQVQLLAQLAADQADVLRGAVSAATQGKVLVAAADQQLQ